MYRARCLTKVYRMGEVEVPALRGVGLELHHGQSVVMLGPPGQRLSWRGERKSAKAPTVDALSRER